jgi:acetoacetate decarboxylase
MKLAEVRANAFAMPLMNPAYPRGPYKFYDREFVVITYRTDPDALRAVVPEPLELAGDTVNYEFIRMPDSTGFGDYTETGQVIPVRFRGSDGVSQEGGYVHAMYLDDNSPIAGGREIWGFPKKLATPKISGRTRLSCVRCIMARCSVSRRRWATSIMRSIASPCSKALPNRTS